MVKTSTRAERERPRRPGTRAAPQASGGSRRHHAIQAAMDAWRRTFGVLHRMTHAGSAGEITMADAFLLHFLALHGEKTPKEIAAFTGLTSGSVTSMLDRLERGGLVQRARSARDRREILVHLTSTSREKIALAMEHAHAGADRLFAGWTTQEIETLAGLLGKFAGGGPQE